MRLLKTQCLQRPIYPGVRAAYGAVRGSRTLLTLAIETSCDDTSVAVLETLPSNVISPIFSNARLHFHKKITANNTAHRGIHPFVAHLSHQETLATLISEAIPHLPGHGHDAGKGRSNKPDFVTVTRGPGMRSCLNTGIDTAKGLAVAWQVPLLGVNHMQAHALTPRLVSALNAAAHPTERPSEPEPRFPYLTLLVSGGHTLLVHSRSLNDHAILASTTDIAIGDCIDKMARLILPLSLLNSTNEIMYGRLLESFAFSPSGPSEPQSYAYTAPTTRQEEIEPTPSKEWGWTLPIPLGERGKSRGSEFSFAGLESHVRRLCLSKPDMYNAERRDLAQGAMRVVFEQLAMRVAWALQDLQQQSQSIQTLVISGGVASNGFLREILRQWLDRKGFRDGEAKVELVAPPVELCTDNAAMIAWCGVEMWVEGWESELGISSLRKWGLDLSGEGGGILGVGGWKRREAKRTGGE